MQQFILGHASGQTADRITADCLAQLGDLPADANIGFVYATDALAADLPRILQRLKMQTGIECWSGAVGVGVCATGQEYYDQPALTVMLGSFPTSDFRTLPLQDTDIESFLESEADWLQGDGFHFGVLHGDPAHAQTPTLIDDLAVAIPGAFFVGGLASSHGQNLVISNTVHESGVSGLLFSSDVPVVTGHTQGCQPIADKHVITAGERNILIELDGRPAFDVFKEDIGEVLAQDLQRIGGYIFAALPIRGSDTGDYQVRNLVGIDVEQGLVAIGDLIATGDEVMFCRRDGNSARKDMQQMLDDSACYLWITQPPRPMVWQDDVIPAMKPNGDPRLELFRKA